MPVLTDEFRITQNDPNNTLYAGTANIESMIAKFISPDRTGYVVRPGDVFSLLAQDTTPTAIANTSVVKLYYSDPNGIVKRILIQVDYTALVEFSDRNKLYTVGNRVEIMPKDQLQLAVIANLATATANTRFQLSCLRGTQLANMGT
jgi:hypothetical protein